MKKPLYAFLLMGNDYQPETHHAAFETDRMVTKIITVSDFAQARRVLLDLEQEGAGAVELCGAFGPEAAEALIQETGNRIAIGYVTHFPKQDNLFDAFWGSPHSQQSNP